MTVTIDGRWTLRRKEVASKLGLSTRTIDRMVGDGRLEGVRRDYFRLIYADSVQAYLAGQPAKDTDVATHDASAATATGVQTAATKTDRTLSGGLR